MRSPARATDVQVANFPYQDEAAMAEKDGKKRKRQSTAAETANKKVAGEAAVNASNIKVNFTNDSGLHPVLVSSPGLTAPSIPFQPYAKALSSKHGNAVPNPATHDLILQSSQHPRLDYTASPSSLDQHLSHYVAVFDPATNQLHVSPAHHVNLRCVPRAAAQENAKDDGRRTYAQQREQLGKEFGTKKAKKAIASKTVNAITKGQNQGGKKTDVQAAILDSIADNTADAPKKEDLESDALASKPIPRPNLAAENAEDVYPFNTMIPPGDARLVQVKDWQEKARADENIIFSHRFPASRVNEIGKSDDILRLKALRYLTLLLEFHDALQNAGRAGKKVPKKDVLSQRLAAWPGPLVDSVRRRFATEANELPKWHMDNLYTHMCALSLFVDGWTTDTSNLKDDLKMENKQITQYFHELGCKVGALTERERENRKLGKAQAAVVKMASLKLPLEFPKQRVRRRK